MSACFLNPFYKNIVIASKNIHTIAIVFLDSYINKKQITV
ncbi:hypothetical protein COI_1138 [Mannheimia haemolytica serotype A2 str. OVINE]|nr:hypothetical protein COI_1138 [Mannheimia haemolytica serotype A2 str. OVINE]